MHFTSFTRRVVVKIVTPLAQHKMLPLCRTLCSVHGKEHVRIFFANTTGSAQYSCFNP